MTISIELSTHSTLDRIADALTRPGPHSSDFDLNPDYAPPEGQNLRDAAVLVPIIETSGGMQVILTKRASTLEHHPGQIAFPGGKKDKTDQDLIHTALREAEEEIALPSNHVKVLGALPSHVTVTNFNVTPIVAHVKTPFTVQAEQGEVAEVFLVPLQHVLTASNYVIQSRRWRGSKRHFYTVPYGPYYIWGATARILRAMAEQVAL